MMRLPGTALVCIALAATPAGAAAQYPVKPVRFIAPYPAGGVNDIIARMLGSRMSAALGQQWVIDNRPGRGGMIGTDAAAKSAPDGYTLVHGGMGSLTLGPFLIDVVAGQVPIGFAPIPSFLPHIRSVRLRGLAVTGLQRSPTLPATPTVDEAGLPGFEMNPWFGVLAPAGTPDDVLAKLNADLVRILQAPDIAAQFRAHGVEPAHSTPQAFQSLIRADLQKWGKVIAEAGIKGD